MEKAQKKRVLVADDEDVIRRLFEMILTSAIPDCEFDFVADGVEAVEKFKEHHHGTLLMDVHMPNMDGVQALYNINEICEGKDWEKPTCVFCTGFATPQSIQNITAANPKHCVLYKPVKNEILVEAVKIRVSDT